MAQIGQNLGSTPSVHLGGLSGLLGGVESARQDVWPSLDGNLLPVHHKSAVIHAGTFIKGIRLISVYLDNQDYSRLTDRTITSEELEIRKKLEFLSAEKRVRFFYSGYGFAEVAPTDKSIVEPSIRRATFMRNICDNNALVFSDDLITKEIGCLLENKDCLVDVASPGGDWWPANFDLNDFLMEPLEDYAASLAMMGRAERRVQERLIRREKNKYVANATQKKGMSLALANAYWEHKFGRISDEDLIELIKENLRDLGLMMSWSVRDWRVTQSLVSLVRDGGKAVCKSLIDTVKISDIYRSNNIITKDGNKGVELISYEEWCKEADVRLVKIVQDIVGQAFPGRCENINAESVRKYCPGLSVTVLSIFDSIWPNLAGSRKKLPTDSQFPDAMHGMYAPYMDIFRADKHMAPHIMNFLEHSGTEVVRKLRDLPQAIEQRLARTSPA